MSLAVALHNARSSLFATAKQLTVSGQNVAGADDPNYSRKVAKLATRVDGSIGIASVERASDRRLTEQVLRTSAALSSRQALANGLAQLQTTIGDTTSSFSLAARIAALKIAVQGQADAPSDRDRAAATLAAAKEVVNALNTATATVTQVRSQADADMAAAVVRVNDLLGQLDALNTAVVRGTVADMDVSDALDDRDTVIKALSAEMGLTVVERSNNDIALYTDSGVPLFDRVPRVVSFESSSTLSPGDSGNAVFVDGVPVTSASAGMKLVSGNIAGLARLRDDVAPTYQAQLDEMARGLIEAFAEADQSGGGNPLRTGLFTYSGGPGVPAGGTAVAGLALDIRINAAADPAAGGSLDTLRDGGMNGANYLYNASSAASFATRLDDLVTGLDAPRSFDSAAALSPGMGLLEFGTSSIGWLEGLRQSETAALDYNTTLNGRALSALSNAGGVNLDDELAHQLALEQSYAASSRLISTINQLFDTLMRMVD